MSKSDTEKKIQDMDPSFLPPIKQNSIATINKHQKNSWHWIQLTSACVIKFILSIIAASLVWKCNSKENILFRIILTILAVMFSEIYILYYAVYRVYMGNKCPV